MAYDLSTSKNQLAENSKSLNFLAKFCNKSTTPASENFTKIADLISLVNNMHSMIKDLMDGSNHSEYAGLSDELITSSTAQFNSQLKDVVKSFPADMQSTVMSITQKIKINFDATMAEFKRLKDDQLAPSAAHNTEYGVIAPKPAEKGSITAPKPAEKAPYDLVLSKINLKHNYGQLAILAKDPSTTFFKSNSNIFLAALHDMVGDLQTDLEESNIKGLEEVTPELVDQSIESLKGGFEETLTEVNNSFPTKMQKQAQVYSQAIKECFYETLAEYEQRIRSALTPTASSSNQQEYASALTSALLPI